jgi:hypothetical protein
MKKSFLIISIFFLCIAQSVWAITITGPTDLFTTGIGDYAAVSGNNAASAPGQVFDVLSLQTNVSESGSNSVDMGDLWDTLNDGGVTTATSLVFGFGLNETGSLGSNYVTITDLDMSFERSGGGSFKEFSLGNDSITVYNYTQGQNTAEARIQVDLGFDFMTEYNTLSTEDFDIFSNITNTSDGFEIYFLSSAFTSTPIPEPATMLLLGSGLIGLAGFGRKKLFNKS